ncbi:MAG TPA: S9 family peptidase [Saprospiraceae bacterium]|nr:S9 family peptidase [Saprospiraceae bacterium]
MLKYFFLFLPVYLFFESVSDTSKKQDTMPEGGDYILPAATLTPEFLWSLGRVQLEDVSPDKTTLLYSVAYTDLKRDSSYTLFFRMAADGQSPRIPLPLPPDALEATFVPDGSGVCFLKSDTLFRYEFSSRTTSKMSNIPMQDYFFAADGKTLVYTGRVKYGQTAADLYPDMDHANVRIIDHLNYRHWKEWDDYFRANLFIATCQPGSKVYSGKNLMPGEPYDANSASCSADGRYVVYSAKKVTPNEHARGTNTEIYLYDTFLDSTFVLSKGLPGYDLDPVFSPDGSRIAWNSMATAGYESDRNRIMVYDMASRARKEITTGFDFNANHPKWIDNQTLVFSSEQQGTVQLMSVTLTGVIRALTKGPHTADRFFPAGNTVYYTRSSYDSPAEVYAVDVNASGDRQLSFVNSEAMKRVKPGRFEARYTPTADGKMLQSWVIYPPDFDPSKKYPVVEYCQGGPQSGLTSVWGLRWSLQLIAAQGYIVLAPNRRGTFGFGSEWTRQVSRNWGKYPMTDLLAAIDDLCKEPYVDKTRLAAVGGSFGGYSTFWLAGNHQKRFKCFISHCGLYNLHSFYNTTDELFFAEYDMGKPCWEDPDNPTFTKYSPHLYLKNWDTPILIIQGGQDFRVPESEAFQAFQEAQLKGVPTRLLYFPEEGHWISKAQNSIVWHREFLGWLHQYLQG